MTRRMETREVEVKVCDFCGAETEHLEMCVLCGRDACYADGLKQHIAYGVEVYRFTEHDRISGRVCRECAAGPPVLVGKALLDFIQKAK